VIRDPAGFQPGTTLSELRAYQRFDARLPSDPALAKARPNGFSSRAAVIGSRRRQRRWRHVAPVEEMGAREEFEIRSSLDFLNGNLRYYALPKEIDPQPDSTLGHDPRQCGPPHREPQPRQGSSLQGLINRRLGPSGTPT
jgi:hypothetical protein